MRNMFDICLMGSSIGNMMGNILDNLKIWDKLSL